MYSIDKHHQERAYKLEVLIVLLIIAALLGWWSWDWFAYGLFKGLLVF